MVLEWRGDQAMRLIQAGAARGLTLGAMFLRGMALPLTPLDRGPLRESAAVWEAYAGSLIAAVSFDTPYAVRQHEELSYHHDVGQAKFLEQPAREQAAEIYRIAAAEVARSLGQAA